MKGRQPWSLLCAPAAKASCSSHANLQVQSQDTIKSLLLAVLTEVHFTQGLPFDSPRRVTFSKYSLHLHCSPRGTGVTCLVSPNPLRNPDTASHPRLCSFWGPGVCQSVQVLQVPQNRPTTATKKKLNHLKLLSRQV